MSDTLLMSRKGVIVALMASVSLVACSTKEGTGTGVGGLLGGVLGGIVGGKKGALIGAAVGALAGNRIGAYLDKKDQEDLNKVTAENIGGMDDGESVTWSNPDKEVSVEITTEGTDNVVRKVAVVRNKDVEAPDSLDIIGALYEVEDNGAYVLSAPEVGGQILDELEQGTGLWVIGSVPGKDWVYVEREGIAIGYVALADIKASTDDETLTAREATMRQELDLDKADEAAIATHFAERGIDVSALGDGQIIDTVSATSVCRDLKYELTAKNEQIEENLRACKAGDGAWEILTEG